MRNMRTNVTEHFTYELKFFGKLLPLSVFVFKTSLCCMFIAVSTCHHQQRKYAHTVHTVHSTYIGRVTHEDLCFCALSLSSCCRSAPSTSPASVITSTVSASPAPVSVRNSAPLLGSLCTHAQHCHHHHHHIIITIIIIIIIIISSSSSSQLTY